ncbi:MAG: DUF2934 domain-containing protein [Candidatus Obscuribacterales bacterium]|nr:DUF2934 domain-containing protein [Candidatus Obscuribacterales bacterium]
MSKVSQPKKTTGSTASAKKEPSKKEELAVSMTIVEAEEKTKASKKAVAETAPVETAVAQSDSTISFDLIQEQAYFLWEKDGYPHGLDEVHWLQAESLLKQQQTEKGKVATKK